MKNKMTRGPWHTAENDNTGDIQAVYSPTGEIVSEYVRNRADALAIALLPDLIDALAMALPFVEDAEKSTVFIPGYVTRRIRHIRALLDKVDGKE